MSSKIADTLAEDIANGIHDFNDDQLKLALFIDGTDFTGIIQYVPNNKEFVGTGYTAGGFDLQASVTKDGSGADVQIEDLIADDLRGTFRWGLVYNSSKSNKAIAMLDFTHVVARGPMTFNFENNPFLVIGG